MRVLLVRHAAPEMSPSIDPARWPLSPTGQVAARALKGQLPGQRVWLSSEEVKALATLTCARPNNHVRIVQDQRFNEVVRNGEPFDDEFRVRRAAWLEGRPDERHSGWETPAEAAQRFDEALRTYASKDAPVVVGSHGMVITAWLVHHGRVESGEAAGRFWRSLAMPAVVQVQIDC